VVFAIFIFTVMMGIVYSLVYQMLRMKQAMDDRRDAQLLAATVLNRVTRELQLATDPGMALIPPDNSTGQTGRSIFFLGTKDQKGGGVRADSVTFMATDGGQYLPDGGTHTGVVQISYRVEEDPERKDGLVLVREELPAIRPADRAREKRMVFPVTKNIVSFRLRYYDAELSKWEDEWGEGRRIRPPHLVELTIVMRSPRGQVERYTTAVAPRFAKQSSLGGS
jgi:hypothetical protein